MRVLITGGNGFLGSHLVRYLVQNDVPCLVLSRRAERIADILSKIQFHPVVDGYKEHTSRIQEFAPTHIVHLAWEGGNAYKDVHDVQQFYTNIPHGIELLRIAASLDVSPHFVGVGSFSEYGELSSPAQETQVEAPRTMYGLAKTTFKTISQRFCEEKNILWTWIRPCYVYGPGDVSTRLLPSVTRSLLLGTPVHLDSCNVTIDYLHVSDFSAAILRVLNVNHTGVINVCSGEGHNLRTLLTKLGERVGRPSLLVFDSKPDRASLSKYIVGSPCALLQMGWTPSISLESGFQSLADEIRYELFLKTNPVEHDGIHPHE
jgi:nucleoside-diphosphate-sugar epimerase